MGAQPHGKTALIDLDRASQPHLPPRASASSPTLPGRLQGLGPHFRVSPVSPPGEPLRPPQGQPPPWGTFPWARRASRARPGLSSSPHRPLKTTGAENRGARQESPGRGPALQAVYLNAPARGCPTPWPGASRSPRRGPVPAWACLSPGWAEPHAVFTLSPTAGPLDWTQAQPPPHGLSKRAQGPAANASSPP